MSLEAVIESWKEVRAGLISEASKIPADQFSFKATSETRSVTGILQHIIESQCLLVGEICRPDTSFRRQPFPELIKSYAPGVSSVNRKDDLIAVLRSSMDEAEAKIRAFGESALGESMEGFDGKKVQKLTFLNLYVGHELYHRGQITVYERLLGIEPALTERFKKIFAADQLAKA